MPNDAKLGLVTGVLLVLIIAVVFFRKEPASAQQPASQSPFQQAENRKPPRSPFARQRKTAPEKTQVAPFSPPNLPSAPPLAPPKVEDDMPLPPPPMID